MDANEAAAIPSHRNLAASSAGAEGSLPLSDAGKFAPREQAFRKLALAELGPIKAALRKRAIAKAWKRGDLAAFKAALDSPGAVMEACGLPTENDPGEGDEVFLPTAMARQGKFDWLRSLLEASEGAGYLLLKYGSEEELAKLGVDDRQFDLAVNIYERSKGENVAFSGVCLNEYLRFEAEQWRGLVGSDKASCKDVLSYAVASGSAMLAGRVGGLALRGFLKEKDSVHANRKLVSIESALRFAESSWESTGLPAFEQCAAALAPLAREAAESPRGVEVLKNRDREAQAAEKRSREAPERTGAADASTEAFMRLVLEEVRALRVEVDKVNARLDAGEPAQAPANLASRLSRWSMGRSAAPEKTPGKSAWRG